MAAELGNLTTETAGIDEEAVKGPKAALEMEVEEARGGSVGG